MSRLSPRFIDLIALSAFPRHTRQNRATWRPLSLLERLLGLKSWPQEDLFRENGLWSDLDRVRFLYGPVPVVWLEAAARLPGKSLHVGMVLWYAAGLAGSASVHLSNTLCLRFGLERYAKYRALHSLGAAKLVSVKSTRGRSPLVTILDWRDEP